MASVKVNIPTEAKQFVPDFNKSYHIYEPSTQRFCKPNAKDVIYIISILSCAFTLFLLYDKICAVEQQVSLENQSAAEYVVMVESTSGADGIPILADELVTIKPESSNGPDRSLAVKLQRLRRQGSGGGYQQAGYQSGAAWNGGGFAPNSMSSDNSHPSIHVTGITSNYINIGDWFMWHSDSEPAYEALSHTQLPFVQHKFVEILQPGYYFIYSQITYKDTNDFAIGHEVVKKANCGIGDDERLLNSIRWQIQTEYLPSGVADPPEDSGYVGGVFYLSANDHVGVRPLSVSGGQQLRRFVADQSTGCYFGMFLLHSNNAAPVATEPCRG